MEEARVDAPVIRLRTHARRFGLALRRPHNWFELVRYCSVGASGYVINLGTFALAYREMPYLLAFAFAFTVAATSNFVWNRLWTFRVRHGVPHHQYARFLTVSLIALGIDTTLLAAFVEVAELAKVAAAALAILIATPVSFFGNKLWSFR
jgi:putative flippase GtrA